MIESGGCGLGIEHMQKDKQGNTPSVFAINNGHTDLAEYLSTVEKKLKEKADISTNELVESII